MSWIEILLLLLIVILIIAAAMTGKLSFPKNSPSATASTPAIKSGIGGIFSSTVKLLLTGLLILIVLGITFTAYTITPWSWKQVDEVVFFTNKWDPINLGWQSYNIQKPGYKYKLVAVGAHNRKAIGRKRFRTIYSSGTSFIPEYQNRLPMKNKNYGCLIGKIDGKTIYLGKKWKGDIENSPIYISINFLQTWRERFKDNEGGFRIKIYRERFPFSKIYSKIFK